MDRILITDNLFVFPEHEEVVRQAGCSIERLDKPEASEEELCRALPGVAGYILGGVEHVTERVIANADSLRAIAFTGTDWKQHIPGWKAAQERGIAISNTPHSNSRAVAEWGLSTGLAMVRDLFALGRTGPDRSKRVMGVGELAIGIVGMGHVGTYVAEMFNAVGVKSIRYWSRQSRDERFEYCELDEVLAKTDLVYVCVSANAGAGFVGSEMLASMKDGAAITVFRELCVDEDALIKELQNGRIRAFLDYTPTTEGYAELPLHLFYCSNTKTSFNTSQANAQTSDMATRSMLNLLATGKDAFRVL